MAVVGDLSRRATAAATRACSAACSASRSSPVHCSAASSSTTSWQWIFYVNLPLGLVALAVIATTFRSPQVTTRHRIDWLGTSVLAAGLSGVILYTSLGGTSYAWDAPGMLAMIGGGLALLALFPLIEARAEPILPPELFRNMTFRTTSAIGFVVGFALFGSVTFIPLYLQIVKGHSATESGLLMTPMMLGVLAPRRGAAS